MRLVSRTFLIALFLTGPAWAADEVALGLHLEAGKTYRHKMETTQNITHTIMGMENKNVQNITFTYSFDVQSVDDSGVATAKVTYEHVAASMSMGPLNATYDSNEPDATIPPSLEPYSELAGTTYLVEVGPDGLINEVNPVNEGGDAEAGAESGGEGFAASNVRGLFEQTFAIYPEEPVAVGDTWSRPVETDNVMPMAIVNKWTLNELNEDSAKIGIDSTLRPSDNAGTIDMQGMEFAFDFEGAQTGTIVIDQPSGWIRSTEMAQNVKGTMTMAGGASAQIPGGLEVPIHMESSVTVTTLD